MKRRVIISLEGPAVRVELWQGVRIVYAFVVPGLDALTVATINEFVNVSMRSH